MLVLVLLRETRQLIFGNAKEAPPTSHTQKMTHQSHPPEKEKERKGERKKEEKKKKRKGKKSKTKIKYQKETDEDDELPQTD